MEETGLNTLERMSLRGDSIEMFKIMRGYDKISKGEVFFLAEWRVIEQGAIA